MIIGWNYGATFQFNHPQWPIYNHSIVVTEDEITEFEAFILGKGLRVMRKPVIFNFDYPQKILPVIELNTDSTAEGEIVIQNETIEENISLTGLIYLVTAPSSINPIWTGTGSDLYNSNRLYLTSKKNAAGKLIIKYSFDPSSISGIAHGQYFGVKIILNTSSDAATGQAGIEIIMKIVNRISIPA